MKWLLTCLRNRVSKELGNGSGQGNSPSYFGIKLVNFGGELSLLGFRCLARFRISDAVEENRPEEICTESQASMLSDHKSVLGRPLSMVTYLGVVLARIRVCTKPVLDLLVEGRNLFERALFRSSLGDLVLEPLRVGPEYVDACGGVVFLGVVDGIGPGRTAGSAWEVDSDESPGLVGKSAST
jgi:hypothetical protein